MKKKTKILITAIAAILLCSVFWKAGLSRLFPHENQQPYSLHWDGQLYRSYAEEWKEPVADENFVGKTESLCPGSKLPKIHGESNCLTLGSNVAFVNGVLIAEAFPGVWWRFDLVDMP